MLLGVATTLAVVVAAASCLVMQTDDAPGPPAAASTPEPIASTSTGPTPGADRATTPPATPPRTAVPDPPRATPSRRPTADPTRTIAGYRVIELRVVSVRILMASQTPVARVVVRARTISTARFELTLFHEGSADKTPGGMDTADPEDATFQLSGATSYERVFSLPVTMKVCDQAYLLVLAVSNPAAGNGPQLGVLADPDC